MQSLNIENWADAIANRISDEWDGKKDFPEDANLLKEILSKLLTENPEQCKKLIGTGVIEENYFTLP